MHFPEHNATALEYKQTRKPLHVQVAHHYAWRATQQGKPSQISPKALAVAQQNPGPLQGRAWNHWAYGVQLGSTAQLPGVPATAMWQG